MAFRFKPSRKQAREFMWKMRDIDAFCEEHSIIQSRNSDSYYFNLNGVSYRVSNHTVEQSNRAAYSWDGEQRRPLYHPDGRDEHTVYIHAGKTRIMDIYTDLSNGLKLNGFGQRV